MSAKSINGRSYASVFFDFAIGINGLKCLFKHWPLSVFCAPEKKWGCWEEFRLQGLQTAPCKVRPSGRWPQPHFSSQMQTGASCKGTAQQWGHCRGSFLHCVLFQGMPTVPRRSSLSSLQQALTFLVQWPPAEEINASHFLSHWENCLTIYGGKNRILRGIN